MRTSRCKWCLRVLDTTRGYCDRHCNDLWKVQCSAARQTDEQMDEWLRAHLRAMAVQSVQDGDMDMAIKLRRELRQQFAKTAVADEIDQAAKDLLDVFG